MASDAVAGPAGSVEDSVERQFNLRIRHPERTAVYEAFSRRSALLREQLGTRFSTHAYGTDERCVIDLCRPIASGRSSRNGSSDGKSRTPDGADIPARSRHVAAKDPVCTQRRNHPLGGLTGVKPCDLQALAEFAGQFAGDVEHPVNGRVGPAGARGSDHERHPRFGPRQHQLTPFGPGCGAGILRLSRPERKGSAVGRAAVDGDDVGTHRHATCQRRPVEAKAQDSGWYQHAGRHRRLLSRRRAAGRRTELAVA